MNWLKQLEDCNISFQAYTLNKEDCIFFKSTCSNQHIIYILDGCIKLLQVFTNKEKICTGIIYKNQIISAGNDLDNRHYNVLMAIKEATVITILSKELVAKITKSTKFILEATLHSYSWKKTHEIAYILSHRNTKKRVIQLLIILVKRFGYIKNHQIIIQTSLSHQLIASITGSQRVTISRIINQLKEKKIIDHINNTIIINNITQLIKE